MAALKIHSAQFIASCGDVDRFLRNGLPEMTDIYLEEILAAGDMELFTAALKDVAEGRHGGMGALS